jgi:hypothetical protein
MSSDQDDNRPGPRNDPAATAPAADFGDWDEAARAIAHLPWRHSRRFFRSLARHCKLAGHDMRQFLDAIETEFAAAWAEDVRQPSDQ